MQAQRSCYIVLSIGILSVALNALTCNAADTKVGNGKKDWRKEPNATQMDLNAGSGTDYAKADQELNRIYKQILAKNKDDRVFTAKFIRAERAWIAFRDAQLDARFPLPEDEYGSACSMCKSIELARLTDDRIKQLKPWLNGVEEGDVCTGSYPIK